MKKQFFKVLSAILLISLILSVIPLAASAADNVDASAFTSVIMNVGADETQKNLTWYFKEYSEVAEVRYGKSTTGNLPASYKVAKAKGTETMKTGYYSYKATMSELQENSTYVYQLVVGNTVSKTYTFKTYDFDDGFTFVFTGDTQIGDASSWADTLNKIQNPSLFGNVSFIVSPGDQISTYNNRDTMEKEYDGYIAGNLSSIAVSTTVGPWHDAEYDQSTGKMLLADAYRDHYNLPNLSDTYGVTETTADYYYTYGNVLFMHLNVTNYRELTKTDFNAHVTFMQKAMKDNPQCNWQIVVMHYPFYTTGSHTNDSITNQFRNQFAPKFNELGIDIVLQGHDHMYTRSHMMTDATVKSNDKVVDNKVIDPVGTLYVCGTSSSGGGYYGHMNDTYSSYIAVERPEYRKGVTFFEVTDNAITLKSYFVDTATPELIDTFTIEKTQVEYNYSASVSVDGGAPTQYDDGYDLSEILAIYNTKNYKGKEIAITLESDLALVNAVDFANAPGASFKIDLNGYTLTIDEGDMITISAENTNLEFYSSFEDGNLIVNDYIYLTTSASVTFGSKQYRKNLSVTSSGYLLNLSNVPTGTTIEANLLYSTFNYGTNGIITLVTAKGAVATLNTTITGSTLNGSTAPFQYNPSKAPTTGGVFSAESTIAIKETSLISSTGTVVGIFEGDNFADRYFGTVTIDDSSFDGFALNGDTILSDADIKSTGYFQTLTNYDPTKTITVGARTTFKNSGNTFASGAFTASNVNLGANSTIKTNGDIVEVAYSFDFTAKVTVNGVANFHKETSLYDILEAYNTTEYAGKEIIITLNKDITTPDKTPYTFDKADNVTIIINLAGYTLTIGSESRLTLASNNYNLTIYSSEKNGKLNLNDAIVPSATGTLILGSKEDKDCFEIYSPDASPTGTYVVDLGALTDGTKVTIKFLYSSIRSTTNGLIRLNAATGAVATIDAEIIGCTIKGKHLIQFNSSGTPGVFSLDSNITFKNTTIESTSTSQRQLFDKGVFANRYFGIMYFEYTSFDRYTINGDLIYSNNDVDGCNYYTSNVVGSKYDPNKVIVIGEGCKFTNTNGSVTADGFTAKNIVLAENCQIEMAGEAVTIIYKEPEIPVEPETPVEPEVPDEPLYDDNVTVVIDGTPVGHDITDLSELLNTLNSANNGKTINIYLNPKASFTIDAQVDLSNANTFVIDLGGATLQMNGMIPMTANAGIQIYSSRAGGKFVMRNRFHINGSSNITLGYDNPKYKDYLTVETNEYILYTGAIDSSVTVVVNYLYSTINCNSRGLMRIRCTDAATLTSEIKGCTIVGTSVLFQSHTGSDYAAAFSETSTISLKDSTFTGPAGTVTNVFETSGEPAFVNKFAGTMTIDDCTFANYNFNAIQATNATIIVGDGTSFTNFGTTFTGNAFTASNIKLASGCEIKADGDKMVILNTGAPDQPDTPAEPETPVEPEQPEMPEYPVTPDQPETPKVTDAPAGTTAIVTIDGQSTYHIETDLYDILSVYNKADYEGKTINIELLADLDYTTENRDYVKANITINVAGKTLTLSRRLNIPSGTKLLVYSSIAGGKLDMYADQGFVQLYKNSELVIGHTNEQYKNFLTVNSAQYLVYTDVLSASSTNNVTFINSTINCGRHNLLRVRGSGSSATPTFNINITGCNITATASIIMFNDGTGTFSANSTLFATNSSFTGPSASQGIFDSTLAGKFTGTMCFTGCTFDNFTINANIIPGAKLIFGAGCSFTNAGATFAGNYFASTNNCVASGCELKADGSKMVIVAIGNTDEPDQPDVPDEPDEPDEPTIPEGTTCIVTVNGVLDKYYSDVIFSDIAKNYDTSDYAGKEIVFTFLTDTVIESSASFLLTAQTGCTFKFDLNGHTVKISNRINIQGSDNAVYFYSSAPGGELKMSSDFGFQTNTNMTLIFGTDDVNTPDKYKNNLEVTGGGNYFVYANGVSGKTVTFKCYYTNMTTGNANYGLICNSTSGDSTLVVELVGSKITGRGPILTIKDTSKKNFVNSTFVATNTTFTAESALTFFAANYGARYNGTMYFEGCTFNNYELNATDVTGATITIGAGCTFTNYAGTFTDGKFTATNITLAEGYELKADGDKMVVSKIETPVEPDPTPDPEPDPEPDEPDVPVEPDVTVIVTINGVDTPYTAEEFSEIFKANNNFPELYDGEVLFTLKKDITLLSLAYFEYPTNCTIKIDLAGHKLSQASGGSNLWMLAKDFTLHIYSSVPGGVLEICHGITAENNGTIILGSEEYKNFLTIDTPDYDISGRETWTEERIINVKPSAQNLTVKFLYSTILSDRYGLVKLNVASDSTATLNMEITGCTITGEEIISYESISGVFSSNSKIIATDTTFKSASGTYNFFKADALKGHYFGTVNFENCTFDGYILNGGAIETEGNSIIVGLGTTFANYGNTFADGKFTAENIKLSNGTILVKNGESYVIEEYKEDTTRFNPLSNLTLYSNIQYNVYVPVLDEIISATLNGKLITSFEGYDVITVGTQKYYKIPVALDVAQAMSNIGLEIKYKSELGGEKTLAYTLNIVKYANAILSGNYLEVEKTLIKDILSYIRSAYVYANTEETAAVVATINAIIGENYDETSKPTDMEAKEPTEGLQSIAMELGNAPAFIFYIADGYTADQYVIRVNGFTPDCEVITEGERTYIKVTMYAYAMADTITYSIKGTDIKGEYNIKAYYEFALTKGEALANLTERLWKYAESANAYREATK